MILSAQNAISPIAAKTIADLELDEKVYKPDFEIATRFQGFSKELVRISLLGLALYGSLVKLAIERGFAAMPLQKIVGLCGLVAFAVCAGCALWHGLLSSRCLHHQLVISRYFGRLERGRWDECAKEAFREEIRRQQMEQRAVLITGNWYLVVATGTLIVGAAMVCLCSILVLFRRDL
jgi:hypothetical protein